MSVFVNDLQENSGNFHDLLNLGYQKSIVYDAFE